MPRSIGAAKFKEQCLSLFDQLSPEGLIITKHGKPVARVLPILRENHGLIGLLANEIEITGEIGSTDSHWQASDQIS